MGCEIDVFLCGQVEHKNLILRSKAKKGDCIFVTGALGSSQSGRHLNFTPRIKEARYLVSNYPLHAMMDISDGLVSDLNHILKQSNKGAILDENNIPVSDYCKSIDAAFYTGEDFELLFTLPKKHVSRLLSSWPFKKRTALSCIGEITAAGTGLKLKAKNGILKKIKLGGYRHF